MTRWREIESRYKTLQGPFIARLKRKGKITFVDLGRSAEWPPPREQ